MLITLGDTKEILTVNYHKVLINTIMVTNKNNILINYNVYLKFTKYNQIKFVLEPVIGEEIEFNTNENVMFEIVDYIMKKHGDEV